MSEALSTPASSKVPTNITYANVQHSLTLLHNQNIFLNSISHLMGLIYIVILDKKWQICCTVTISDPVAGFWTYIEALCDSLRQLACLPHVPVTTGFQNFLSLIESDPAYLVGSKKVKCSVGKRYMLSIKNICCSLRGLTWQLQNSLTQILMPVSGLCRKCMHMVQRHSAGWTPMYY